MSIRQQQQPPIAFRPSDEVRAELHRLARSRGESINVVVRALAGERLPERAREDELIGALVERCAKITIALSHSDGGPLPVVTKVAPRGASIEAIAVVEARRRGDRVAVELAGRGEFVGCRILLMIAPAGRRVTFEVVPADLDPVTS